MCTCGVLRAIRSRGFPRRGIAVTLLVGCVRAEFCGLFGVGAGDVVQGVYDLVDFMAGGTVTAHDRQAVLLVAETRPACKMHIPAGLHHKGRAAGGRAAGEDDLAVSLQDDAVGGRHGETTWPRPDVRLP